MQKSSAMASRPVSSTICFILLLLSLALLFRSHEAQGAGAGREEHYVSVRRVVYWRQSAALPVKAVTTAEEEEAYEPFEVCKGCRCCAATNASDCVDTSCCYAIDCDIPGKPFGVCAFTPRTCGCGTTNCTEQPS